MKKKVLSVMLVSALAMTMLAGCGSSSSEAKEEKEEEKEEEKAEKEEEKAEEDEEKAETDEEEGKEKAAEKEEEKAEKAEEKEEEDEEKAEEDEAKLESEEETTITVYAAASLETVMNELIDAYEAEHPNVEILGSYDSSGTLLTQIEEAGGNGIDIFFSAAQKQMNTLQDDDDLVVDGTRHNVLNNQVCVVTYTDSGTEVTGINDLDKAASLALADGSVPAGKYTRDALISIGVLPEAEDSAAITTEEVSDALGGIEINECSNVSKVLQAVAEHSNEVGTCYYSDTYGYEDDVDILEVLSYDLTGDVIYPVAQVKNGEADEVEEAAALDFINFLISDEAKAILDKYYFDTDVED